MKAVIMTLVSLALPLAASAATTPDDKPVAIIINDPQGKEVGALNMTQEKDGVRVQVNLKMMKPGTYAIHFHENGSCKGPDFKAAGEHFNPTKQKHGSHAGDLKNIEVKADGTGELAEMNPKLSLREGPNSLLKTGGTAIVVHEKADDYKTQPSGGSGKRIACGEIKRPDETKVSQ